LDFRLSQGSVARYCRRDGTLCESPGERILKIGPLLPKLLSNIKGLTYFGTRCISTPPNRTGIWLDCKKTARKFSQPLSSGGVMQKVISRQRYKIWP